MTSLQISSETLQAVVERTIIEGLTAEEKEALLAGAIKEMVAPSTGYRNTESPLQVAIRSAITRYTNAAAELLITPEVKAQIDQLVKDGIAKAVADQETFVTTVASAAGQALEKALRGY